MRHIKLFENFHEPKFDITELDPLQAYKLIDFLEADISMYGHDDLQYYEDMTGIPVGDLMDMYVGYGYKTKKREGTESLKRIYLSFKKPGTTWDDIKKEAETMDESEDLSEAKKKETSYLVDGKFISWYEVLQIAYENYKGQFGQWHFDERDSADSLQSFVEKLLEKPMTKEELADKVYLKANKLADELGDAASHIGYAHRTAGQMNPKAWEKAEKAYDRLLAKIF